MAMACKICGMVERGEIEKLLAQGLSNRRIASQFSGINEANVRNHLKHYVLPAKILEESQIEFHNMLMRHSLRLEKLLAACDEWLTDPDDETKYTIAPRAEDIRVVYEKEVGDKMVMRSAQLSDLIEPLREQRLYVLNVNVSNDKYKLFLDTIGKLHDKLDILARISGLYQKERQNEYDFQAAIELAKYYIEDGLTTEQVLSLFKRFPVLKDIDDAKLLKNLEIKIETVQ